MVNDSLIISRIKYYLVHYAQFSHEAVVDLNWMARSLQFVYPDYRDCDKVAFRMLVHRAYIKLSESMISEKYDYLQHTQPYEFVNQGFFAPDPFFDVFYDSDDDSEDSDDDYSSSNEFDDDVDQEETAREGLEWTNLCKEIAAKIEAECAETPRNETEHAESEIVAENNDNGNPQCSQGPQ